MSAVAVNLDVEEVKTQDWWFTVQEAVVADRDEDCLPAVEVLFAPIGMIALRAARRAAGEVYSEVDEAGEDAPLTPDLLERAGDALSRALLIAGIKDWKGVGVADAPVLVTPERVEIFLRDPGRFEKLDAAYVRPFVMRELEKNGLSLSPNGISAAGAKPTAKASAKPKSTGAARRTKRKA